MQSSNQPGKISVPFAESGQKQTIPVASQVGIEDGRASYTTGFPELTRTPLAAGGVPPFGTDMNGILFALSAIQQWQSAGGGFVFDSAFAAAVGGYPKGAKLLKADLSGFWINTVESNVANPDTGGAGWLDASGGKLIGVQRFATPGTFTYTPSAGTKSIIIEVQAAGGGGGSAVLSGASQVSAGAGGGGGGYAKSRLTSGFSGLSVVVGQGGAPGVAGGASSFGGLISATGGSGAPTADLNTAFPVQRAGSMGGGASGGNILNITGDSGWPMLATIPANGISGKGGASAIAPATRSVVDNNDGVAGQFGSGGSGAISQAGPARTGGAGGNGIVIIHEYS